MSHPLDGFRPLLAATVDPGNLEVLRFPLWCSAKLDGVRVLCHPTLGPVTRSLKPVKNKYIRTILSGSDYAGFDGEVMVGGSHNFQQTLSGVMSEAGAPDFVYHVFDDFTFPNSQYIFRFNDLQSRVEHINRVSSVIRLQIVEQVAVDNLTELDHEESHWLEQGYEGVMLRSGVAAYKFNRSTLKQQILIKLKRFVDDEARVIDFEEKLTNTNEAKINELGYTNRSDHKAMMVPAGTLGALVVDHPEFGTFNIGSGFDDAQRYDIWMHRPDYFGKYVTFKYQPTGIKEKPRFPIFKGFRPKE